MQAQEKEYKLKIEDKDQELLEIRESFDKERESWEKERLNFRKKQKPVIKDALESFTYSGIDSKTTDASRRQPSGRGTTTSSRHSLKVPQDT